MMKTKQKIGMMMILVMIISILSVSVSAQTPCEPQNNNAECSQGRTCQYYEEYGYACGFNCNGIGLLVGDFDLCGGQSKCNQGNPEPPCLDDGQANCCVECLENTDCSGDEVCDEGLCEEPGFSVFDMMLGFDIAENFLHQKLLFTLHIIKEQLFQTEFKIIETSLSQKDCAKQPLSFAMSKEDYRYGKIEEIDSLLDKLVLVIEDNQEKYPVDFIAAQDLLLLAESFEETDDFLIAFDCKCLAYKALVGDTDNTVTCEEPQECGGIESCLCAEFETCPTGCGTCTCVGSLEIDQGKECTD